jgi:hypothetical protein
VAAAETMSNALPMRSASLESPLYYLENLDTVVNWVYHNHLDLLLSDEAVLLENFRQLDEQGRALLTRLIMRKGEWFRTDKIDYAEIPEQAAALQQLVNCSLIDYPAPCNLTEWCQLALKDELIESLGCLALHCENTSKAALQNFFIEQDDGTRYPLSSLLQSPSFELIKLNCNDLFQRIKILFFGNAQQDWSEFVLSELGHQRYEVVNFDQRYRAFQTREELDFFITMSLLNDALYLNLLSAGEIAHLIPTEQQNSWLEYRRQKLIFRCAHAIERSGDPSQALYMYRGCTHPEAKIRQLRVLEKTAPDRLVFRYAKFAYQHPRVDVQEAALKVWQRAAKKINADAPPKARFKPSEWQLQLPRATSVERACRDYYHSDTTPCFYVENALLPTLLALCIWPAIFAPLAGAFFNPFQRRPADLYQTDFITRRQQLIEQSLQLLEQPNYREVLIDRYHEKSGIACQLAIWPVLNEELVSLALQCIPAKDLRIIFEHMLADLRQHCSGLPDLIRFDTLDNSYQLIEVKGPGDKLQDHQKRWLSFFKHHNIDAHVCYVNWETPCLSQ